MKNALRVAGSVARATLLEGLQQPIALLLALACFELAALQPVVQLHTFGEAGRLTRDCGMAFMLVFGVLLAAATAGFSLAGEIRDGTAATALAKPIGRASFLAGKFLGACGVLLAFSWCCTWTVLLACRTSEAMVQTEHTYQPIRDAACGAVSIALPLLCLAAAAFVNARTRRRLGLWFFLLLSAALPLAAGALGFFARDGWPTGWSGWSPQLDARIAALAVLVAMLLAVFAAIATALSTRLQTGPALAVAFLVLFLGFLADGLRGSAWGRLPAALVPDVQAFWVADRLAGGGTIPLSYVARAGGYAAACAVFALSLGVLSFQRKDL